MIIRLRRRPAPCGDFNGGGPSDRSRPPGPWWLVSRLCSALRPAARSWQGPAWRRAVWRRLVRATGAVGTMKIAISCSCVVRCHGARQRRLAGGCWSRCGRCCTDRPRRAGRTPPVWSLARLSAATPPRHRSGQMREAAAWRRSAPSPAAAGWRWALVGAWHLASAPAGDEFPANTCSTRAIMSSTPAGAPGWWSSNRPTGRSRSVGLHYHFAETNGALDFDRDAPRAACGSTSPARRCASSPASSARSSWSTWRAGTKRRSRSVFAA